MRDYGDEVGWEAFWEAAELPFSSKHVYTPSILLVMIRTLQFSGISYKRLRLKSADLCLYPDPLKFKRTDFQLAEGIQEAGHECMRANILRWLEQPESIARRPDLAGKVAEQAKSTAATGSATLSHAG